GSGDQVLTNIELRDLVRMLKTEPMAGGWQSFTFDASALKEQPEVNDHQPIQAVYNAGFSGLNLDFNRVQVEWSRAEEGGQLKFRARAVADGLNVPADWVDFLPAASEPPPGANFLYSGDASQARWLYAPDLAAALPEQGAIFLPVRNTAENTAEVFRALAQANGVALPEPHAGDVPSSALPLGT